jgi:hypothetical protein
VWGEVCFVFFEKGRVLRSDFVLCCIFERFGRTGNWKCEAMT